MTAIAAPALDRLVVADAPGAWAALGFRVERGTCRLGSVELVLAGSGPARGLTGWSLRGVRTGPMDGLEAESSARARPEPAAAHPNGCSAIDHVVAFSHDLDATIEALRVAGLALRRVREQPTPAGAPRQAFFRLEEIVLEVVQVPDGRVVPGAPARLWGLALVVGDLPALAASLGDRLGSVRDAVQPGRRIASLRREAGLTVSIAFMTPAPGSQGDRRPAPTAA